MARQLHKLRALLWGEFRLSPWRTLIADPRLRILVATRFAVRGVRSIMMAPGSRLYLGTTYFGFVDRHVRSLLRIRGQLLIDGVVRVGRGASWDVGPNAVVRIGGGTYFSPYVRLISASKVSIGERCAIGWGTEIVDTDFHTISAPGRSEARGDGVRIGDRVWIGSNVRILRGATLADGCVVAAGSVVTKRFDTPNCLLAGVPARVVRESVGWG